MATLIVMPVIDIGIRSWPFRIHSAAWRLGFVGGGSAVLVTPLLALYLIYAIAAIADDRLVEYLVASLAAAAAVLCLGAAALFLLDVLQMKDQVSAIAASQYDIGSIWVIARLPVVAVLFIVLAVSSMRTARGAPHKPSAVAGRAGGQVLIRTTLLERRHIAALTSRGAHASERGRYHGPRTILTAVDSAPDGGLGMCWQQRVALISEARLWKHKLT